MGGTQKNYEGDLKKVMKARGLLPIDSIAEAEPQLASDTRESDTESDDDDVGSTHSTSNHTSKTYNGSQLIWEKTQQGCSTYAAYQNSNTTTRLQ